MTTAQKLLLLSSQFNPYGLANNAAIYDLSDLSSLIYDGSNRVTLVGDKSGNSSVNCLVLNGLVGNYASTTKYIPGAGVFRVEVEMSANSYTPGYIQILVGVWRATTNHRSWQFQMSASGALVWVVSSNGISAVTATSSIPIPAGTKYAALSVNIANGVVDFETSFDGTTWTQLGTQQNYSAVTLFDATAILEIGSTSDGTATLFAGRIGSVRLYFNGTKVRGFNAATAAKLATSVVDEVSGTWTINTSGDTGARICGARDLYQGTASKQPILSVVNGYNTATFDGVDDYMKSAAFSLSQAVSDYTIGSMVAWANGGYISDGASAANTMGLVMTTSTPQINLNAGSSVAGNTGLAVGVRGIISAIFNGASSLLQIGLKSPTSGNAGSGTPNGITIGASGASTAANFANITFSAKWVRSVADSGQISQKIVQYLMRKWGVSG